MSNLWSMLTLAGLWGFVGCTAGFILKAFPARDCFERRNGLLWGALLLLFFLLWMVGMANA
ncbi:hypothetical protein [Geomonas sp.]|uniref:hypothetical protein n=1 Tax=Geomonas sp. TaxID=2651584 RepID=UPI002B4A9FAF|nr:hypothetical protein [Geomonas sp.]HJV34086.1 hypothetical protein [Geomonas sp.]